MAPPKKTCFFVTPIGSEESGVRNRSDWILRFMLRPVLGTRYKLIRGDQISEPGSITEQVVKFLADSDLVIADLTNLNANVVYELSVRHTLNRPCIQIMDQDQKLPFDLLGERTIFFKHENLKSLERATSQLKKAVQQTERPDFICTSPISRSIDIADMLQQTNEARDQLARILQEMLNLKDVANSIESDQSSVEVSISGVETDVSEIKDMLDNLGPQQPGSLSESGIYIDDAYIVRLLQDVELLLKRGLTRL